MEESVLLGTKPFVDSIRHFIRDPSGVLSLCHLCECRIVQWRHDSRLLLLLNWFLHIIKRTLRVGSKIWNLCWSGKNNISLVCCAHSWDIVFAPPCNILYIIWLRREGRVCWIIFSPLFLRYQKVSVQHFDTSIQSRGWLKGSFSRHKTTFKRVIELEWPLPGSTAGKYLPEVSRTKFNCRISWHFAAISNFSWFLVKTGTF